MEYRILDNFLNSDSLSYLSSLELKKVEANEVFSYQNKIDKNGQVNTTCIDPKILKNLQETCHNTAIKILDELAPQKTHLYEYSDFNIIETGKDYIFPIHRDHVNKLLSGVIYLKPKNNTGTIIYKNKEEKIPKKLNGKKIELYFFQELKKLLGIIIKEMERIIE